MLYFFIALLLAIAPAVSAFQWPFQMTSKDPQCDERRNPLTKEFRDYVCHLLESFKVPSLAVAVVDGEDVYSSGYGTAIFPSTAATSETLYYTGSTTKSFTAAALTMLADSSANSSRPLRLTDPLREHLPFFKLADDYATLHTTIEDALSHRSGLPTHELAYDDDGYMVDDLIAALPHLPLTAEPRTKYQYCNIMYMLASKVIENYAHTSVGEFFTKHIWAPFGMHSTYFTLADAQSAEKNEGKQLARGYYWDRDTETYREEPWMDSPLISGAGHTISNVDDYARYLSAMMNKLPPISDTGYQHLRKPRTIITDNGASTFPPGLEKLADPFTGPFTYALGWEQRVYRGVELYMHEGGLFGFSAVMLYMPSIKWGVVMMGNTEVRCSLIETLLLYKLLDDKLSIPHADRQDTEQAFKDVLELRETRWLNSTARLYPDATQPPAPLTRPVEEYTGEYWHPGYQNLTLSLGKAVHPGAPADSQVLQTQTWNKIWKANIQLEHVSGEHFVFWSLPLESRPSEISKSAIKAEFRVAANGNVVEVGVALGSLPNGEKIWFKRRQ